MKITSIKKVTFLLSFTACFIHASEPLNQKTWFAHSMELIGKSSFMEFCSKNIQTKIDQASTRKFVNIGDEPASTKYQEMGSQAQFALGIAQDRHVSVKKLNQALCMASLVKALAEADAIYVNEERMNEVSYGTARSSMFHEAVHVKYHDKMADTMIEDIGIIGGSIVLNTALKALNITAWRKRTSFMVALGLTTYASLSYRHFMERRADIEGHKATQCSSCVSESASRRKQSFEEKNSPLKDNGYLWSAELEKIAQNFGDKKCAYHSEQKK